MIRDTSPTPHLRKQIGSALWLFVLLAAFAPADWTGDASGSLAHPRAPPRIPKNTKTAWQGRVSRACAREPMPRLQLAFSGAGLESWD
jgi:hypothetical protein